MRLSFSLQLSIEMGKSKSSASSATRKKHAKKAAEDEEGVPAAQPAQRGQKKAAKKSRFEPKVKSYTPPPAPPRGAPDPVDLYLGGGSEVDSELVVILRKLGKRDEATISKGVEGLESWIREVMREESKGVAEEKIWKLEQQREQIVSSMAVWVSLLCPIGILSASDVLTSVSGPGASFSTTFASSLSSTSTANAHASYPPLVSAVAA